MAGTAGSRRRLAELKRIAASEASGGRPLIEDDAFARQVARIEIELAALEITELRALSAASRGEQSGAQASLFKIKGTEIQQRLTELALEAVGNYALVNRPTVGQRSDMEAGMAKLFASETAMQIALNAVRIHGGYGYSTEFDVERYFRDAPLMIVGEGTNEIQRNIIAKAALDL
jgi:alkylation response protein AidB-like acyl-CoA dehydrogenase